MSKLNRQSQHRPSRDTAKSKELADLKRENHKLKKQVAQGRKAVQRVVETSDGFRGLDREVVFPAPEMRGCVLTRETIQGTFDKMNEQPSGPPVRIVPPGVCRDCGHPTKKLELGPKTIEICGQCGWRKPVKPDPI